MYSGSVIELEGQLTTNMRKILLVDDHELVRAGIRLLIESVDPDAEIIEASTGEQSIELVSSEQIDLVFMDVILPGIDGVASALHIIQQSPGIKIIILTGRSDLVVPKALLESGISGYITKSSAAEEIGNAIAAANQGEFFLSPDLRQRFENECEHEVSPFDRLSYRELQVVLLLLKGVKTSDVGESLQVNAKTVSTYKRRAYEKLGVDNTPDLVKLAMEYSLLDY